MSKSSTAVLMVRIGILFDAYGGVKYDVAAVGLDSGARNFYMTEGGRPCTAEWAAATGSSKWVGTRFSDGSAVAAAGFKRQPVEFLGTFHGE